MTVFRASFLVIALLAWAPCLAQTKVYVATTGDDSVGKRLTYSIKQEIRRSASMELVDRDEDALITLNMVTFDPDQNSSLQGNRTIYSVVWTARTFHETPVPMYLGNYVGICGEERVEGCGGTVVAESDSWASRVRSWIQEAIKQSET